MRHDKSPAKAHRKQTYWGADRLKRSALYLAIISAAGFGITVSVAEDRQASNTSHVTIHVDRPLLEGGGTVLVVALPVDLHRWNALPPTPESKSWLDNPKRSELGAGDRLFEARITEKVSIIEFVYPRGGTFGFNLIPAGGQGQESTLKTRQLLAGSGYYTDRKTGEKRVWDNVSTIHIYGPDADEAYSRAVRMASGDIMNAQTQRQEGVGTIVYTVSAETLEKVVVTEAR